VLEVVIHIWLHVATVARCGRCHYRRRPVRVVFRLFLDGSLLMVPRKTSIIEPSPLAEMLQFEPCFMTRDSVLELAGVDHALALLALLRELILIFGKLELVDTTQTATVRGEVFN
jgi:hypothetical protein